jgi:hypothetical protein
MMLDHFLNFYMTVTVTSQQFLPLKIGEDQYGNHLQTIEDKGLMLNKCFFFNEHDLKM